MFAEDVADTRRWRVQLQRHSQLESASEAAERELLAGLEEEAKMEAEEATRRQHNVLSELQEEGEGSQQDNRTTNQPEPSLARARAGTGTGTGTGTAAGATPSNGRLQRTMPAASAGHGSVLRPLMAVKLQTPRWNAFHMVMAVLPHSNRF